MLRLESVIEEIIHHASLVDRYASQIVPYPVAHGIPTAVLAYARDHQRVDPFRYVGGQFCYVRLACRVGYDIQSAGVVSERVGVFRSVVYDRDAVVVHV